MLKFFTVLSLVFVAQSSIAQTVGDGIREVVIATDVDYNSMIPIINHFKGSAATCNSSCQALAVDYAKRQIQIVFENADRIFRRDLGITLKMGHQNFWLSNDTPGYPYTNLVGPYESLSKLRSYVQSAGSPFAGKKHNLVHIFTNAIAWTGNSIGVADLKRACGQGVSISTGLAFQSPTVDTPPHLRSFIHEVGHVLGAEHSSGIMGKTYNSKPIYFSKTSQEQIWNYMTGSASCFEERSDLTPRTQMVNFPTFTVKPNSRSSYIELRWKPSRFGGKPPVRYILYKTSGAISYYLSRCEGQVLSENLPVKSSAAQKALYRDTNVQAGTYYWYSMRGVAEDGTLGECTEPFGVRL